jgi:uncharacterized protein YbjT (DUF2867 family)
MSQKKIITVFGATGAQGGGLVRAILHDKHSEFAVRAVTRDPDSEHATHLQQWVLRSLLLILIMQKMYRKQ